MSIRGKKAGKGFTLMEMLIVVAIIAVLTAVAIPTFSGQLEKSREATDMANVRSAYAEVLSEVMLYDDESISKMVDLKQKKDGFQTPNVDIGGITSDNANQWIGTPQADGKCKVYYDPRYGAVLNWNGGSIWTSLGTRPGYWSGKWTHLDKENQSGSQPELSISTWDTKSQNGLYKLEAGKTYRVTCTFDPHTQKNGSQVYRILASGLLVFNNAGYSVLDTGVPKLTTDLTTANNQGSAAQGKESVEASYRYTEISDDRLTYTITFNTPPGENSSYFLAMNFIARDTKMTGVNMSRFMSDEEIKALEKQIRDNFVLEEVPGSGK